MRPRLLWAAACAALCVCASAPRPAAESNASWLERVNFYRASASLRPVVEDPRLSQAVRQHARYMVMHDVVAHEEQRRDRWATADGAAAAAVSNLAGSNNPFEPDVWAVDTWMQAPFHALGILDPALHYVGFGIHRAQNGGIQTAAGLDIIRGRGARPDGVRYPIVWPADGATVPLTMHRDEWPSPLSSCPGYQAPAGLPLIVQIGSGELLPHVIGSWLWDGPETVEHCLFHEGTYRNGDASEQALGRSILAARDAIVLVPRRPLRAGASYRATIETGTQVIEWRFSVGLVSASGPS
jgi:cysteine-rich secretory family protein